jgi:hypothetical protein
VICKINRKIGIWPWEQISGDGTGGKVGDRSHAGRWRHRAPAARLDLITRQRSLPTTSCKGSREGLPPEPARQSWTTVSTVTSRSVRGIVGLAAFELVLQVVGEGRAIRRVEALP